MSAGLNSSLAGRVLHLSLDVIVRPKDSGGVEPGHTDAAVEIGRRLSLEAGLLAKRMAGEDYEVIIERSIVVY